MITYLITGGTGYIGSLIVKRLYDTAVDSEPVTCILPVRNIEKAERQYSGISDAKKFFKVLFIKWDMLDRKQDAEYLKDHIKRLHGLNRQINIDYIVHCAAVTSSRKMIENPVEVSSGIINGTLVMLEIARMMSVRHMVCLSSMEVYGTVDDIGRPRKEDELGVIDLSSARSSYPAAKRMQELYCHSYYLEYKVPVSIGRLAQTFGAGVRMDDTRVYMQFAKAVHEGKDIILRTEGSSYGNYCAGSDAIEAIILLLTKGESGCCYNIVNEENTMSIRDMAELAATEISGDKIKVRIEPVDEKITGYAKETKLRMSGSRLRALGWKPQKNMRDMYREILAEIQCSCN